MKRFGKFEKKPAAKRVLMQTYITSLICLMLCVTMFFGTTAAWFSSTVETPRNQIMIGTLKVEMNHASFSNGILGGYSEVTDTYSILKDTIKWEPNYTAVEKFEIVEKGDLAFAYQMTVTYEFAEDVNSELYAAQEAVAKAITVWTYTGEDTDELPVDFKELVATDKWTEVGTLFDVINGELPVFQGSMDSEMVNAPDDVTATHMIALHMDENFTGLLGEGQEQVSIQGTKLENISIKLVATQMFSEKDAFGYGYDEKKVDLSVMQEIKTDDSNVMTEAAVLTVTDVGSAISSASVTAPVGTVVADGVNSLTFKVTQAAAKDANTQVDTGKTVLPLNIELEGLAPNTVADFTVTLNLATGLPNLTVYHSGVLLTEVANSNGESASYDVDTGILTMKVKGFSPFDVVYGADYVATEAELKDALEQGGPVVLMSDINLGDTQITIPFGVTAKLDLNGYTISQTKAQTTAYAMIDNKGTLTITDNVGAGKISYVDSGTGGEYASNTIRNEGVLNITGGTVENLSSDAVAAAGYPHAIDVYQGSVTNIYGGTIKSANYDCIRMFCNSDTVATTVNIYGGNIINRVSFQNPGSNVDGIGILNITGGIFTTTENVTANVRLLNFSTICNKMKATISGGTFDKGIKTQNNVSNLTIDWLEIADGVTVTIFS